MNKLVSFVLLMMIICCSHAQIYKWTDSQGVVHFSDKPHEGAEKVKIPETQTYTPPENGSGGSSEPKEVKKEEEEKYTRLEIIQPQNEATIRNNQGYVVVAVQIEPDLSSGDNLQLIFDGAPLGDPQPNLLFQLNGIYRGSHTIAVQVLNANGEVVKTSESITIYMHRPRVGMVKGRNKNIKAN
ncbi:hypothetical protein EP47_05615 [Legionella norrlandica]|uniref:DUF4124 domain-containing protein n=1 Tax=Legionella norrlandica TaxID=1498499 RepID=A0A0A2SUR9_9GAMM|nr:DUF4124 domain-containing protein [Legionella norrlandica]KGP63466.1 hypothetical protein EP47_05615 [Legionella norrlandica]